jgi:GNAT superfamily N-acetyltransferase
LLTLATLRSDHLPEAAALSASMGWPFRVEDWRFALGLGQGIAVLEQDKLVATSVWWPYEPNFASAGMIIVTKALQGRGIGRMMMDEMLTQTADRSVFLNSTREGYRLYEQYGFKPYGKIHQHQAPRTAFAATTPPGLDIGSMRAEDRAAVHELDRCATGMGRSRLLDAIHSDGHTIVARRNGRITGFACRRRFGRGHVIGPVVAEHTEVAQALIESLAAQHIGEFVRIDVTDASGLASWLIDWGLPQVDTVISMARGDPPAAIGNAALYSLASQSLG